MENPTFKKNHIETGVTWDVKRSVVWNSYQQLGPSLLAYL